MNKEETKGISMKERIDNEFVAEELGIENAFATEEKRARRDNRSIKQKLDDMFAINVHPDSRQFIAEEAKLDFIAHILRSAMIEDYAVQHFLDEVAHILENVSHAGIETYENSEGCISINIRHEDEKEYEEDIPQLVEF